jgi:hypothetical protein
MLSGRYQGGQLNPVDQSTADIFGGSIRPAPKMKGGKEVTISFAKAVAQENKQGSVTSAQKASRATKKVLGRKATQAPQGSKAKQGTKRKRTAENEVIDENAGPTKLVQGVKRQRRGRGRVPILEQEPVLETTQGRSLQRRA